MLLWTSTNTQSIIHYESSYNSELINSKLRDLSKLLRYLGRIVTSTFTFGTGGCAGRPISPSFPGCPGLTSVFPVILSYT